MKENMGNYRHYQTKGLINKDQLTNQVALYYQQQNNLLGLSGQNEQNGCRSPRWKAISISRPPKLTTRFTRWSCRRSGSTSPPVTRSMCVV